MNTQLIKIKYVKWDGDPIAMSRAFADDSSIRVNVSGTDLILESAEHGDQFIRIKRGLFVVAIPDPATIGYKYYRMSREQFNEYVNKSNQGGHIIL